MASRSADQIHQERLARQRAQRATAKALSEGRTGIEKQGKAYRQAVERLRRDYAQQIADIKFRLFGDQHKYRVRSARDLAFDPPVRTDTLLADMYDIIQADERGELDYAQAVARTTGRSDDRYSFLWYH